MSILMFIWSMSILGKSNFFKISAFTLVGFLILLADFPLVFRTIFRNKKKPTTAMQPK